MADSGDERVREDEDDHDLLTYGEARTRLTQEISRLAAELARSDQAGDPEPPGVRDRLDALQAAAERNARQPITDDNFTRFFGYEGKAQRNTT
jgi:hypothetical protein